MKKVKMCELDPNKVCDNCNKCNMCDLDPTKICDNCGKCLETSSDYLEIPIEGICDNEDDAEDYIYDVEEECQPLTENDDTSDNDNVEFIEDIPELKDKYDKILEDILKGKESTK